MVRRCCSPRSAMRCLGCAMSSVPGLDPGMPPTPATSSNRPSPRSAPGRSRSSGAPMTPRASCCCLVAGSSSAPSLGSIAIVAWPRTSKQPSKARSPGSSSPTSSCSRAGSHGYEQSHQFTSQTLRNLLASASHFLPAFFAEPCISQNSTSFLIDGPAHAWRALRYR